MQVKKFEARTMKEALEMVKKQLGPEAIILGARDNRKSYGLIGEGSVEVTAAITDEVVQKKKFAESKMLPQTRDKFQNSPARVQKQVMENFVARFQEQTAPKKVATKTRYIEIDEHENQYLAPSQQYAQQDMDGGGSSAPNPHAQARIKSAAQRAWNAMQSHGEWVEPKNSLIPDEPTESERARRSEIIALKSELEGLKQVLSQFQKVPQNVVNSHPGADFGLGYEFSSTFEKLTQAGVMPEIASDILNLAQTQMPPIRYKNKALVDAWTARYILDSTEIVGDKVPAKIQIFVGPSGAGKTSSLVKMAAHAAVTEGKKVVLLTADTMKVGAIDQMRIYANILNTPFAVVRRGSDWTYLAQQLTAYDLILCDFPGMTLKSVDEISMLRNLLPPESMKADVHLVLTSSAKNQDLMEIGKRYKNSHFTDVIFTGLDESVHQGNIYNFMRTFETKLHSFGTGSRVPEDFEIATKERVLDLIFKLSKVKKAE